MPVSSTVVAENKQGVEIFVICNHAQKVLEERFGGRLNKEVINNWIKNKYGIRVGENKKLLQLHVKGKTKILDHHKMAAIALLSALETIKITAGNNLDIDTVRVSWDIAADIMIDGLLNDEKFAGKFPTAAGTTKKTAYNILRGEREKIFMPGLLYEKKSKKEELPPTKRQLAVLLNRLHNNDEIGDGEREVYLLMLSDFWFYVDKDSRKRFKNSLKKIPLNADR